MSLYLKRDNHVKIAGPVEVGWSGGAILPPPPLPFFSEIEAKPAPINGILLLIAHQIFRPSDGPENG